MSKLPWDKFFWSDYETDSALKLCSLASQGLWMRMLCVCAYAEPKGYLMVAGAQLSIDEMVTLFGKPASEIEPLLEELEKRNVFSRNKAGIIYNRKMVRAEKKAKIAKENGKNGGNPSLSKQKTNHPSVNQNQKTKTKSEDNQIPGNNQKPEARSQKLEEEITPPSKPISPPEGGEQFGGGAGLPEGTLQIPATANMTADELCEIPEDLRRRPPLAEQCEPIVPGDSTPSDVIVKTYLTARDEVFGRDYLASRPGMAGADSQAGAAARRWLKAGATPELVREVTLAELEKFKARGNTYPPTVMHYLEEAIARAIKAESRPMSDGGRPGNSQGGVHPDSEVNQWRMRVQGYLQNDGFWMDSYGPTPDQPGCECPREILEQFGYGRKDAAQ